MLKKIAQILVIITWPLSLFVGNTFPNFIHYLLPPTLTFIMYFLWTKKVKYFFLPIFLVPIIEPKFAILPLLFFVIYFNKNIFKLRNLIFIFLSFIILAFSWKSF